ncbi:hypothetical protein K435DRAFT_867180 [Dendrothele bispora CBS 962.96]|uniref:Uncharacterized protein n=1 Tax=Dendrothele bispora (strain CBS 962.96) TaxID=1314807 RepID=A0A4S8LGC4_DENBC|nr:hypothetical protein K435DRAFT_867180 [Dendrothele bispora CBS 962.96]
MSSYSEFARTPIDSGLAAARIRIIAKSEAQITRHPSSLFSTTCMMSTTSAALTPAQSRNSSPQPPPPNQLAASKPSSASKQPQSSENSAEKKLDPFSCKKSSQSLPSSAPFTQRTERSLHEVIGETFPPFDHQGLIVGPFTEETARDATFE